MYSTGHACDLGNCPSSESRDVVPPAYQPRDPSGTVLYQVIAAHLETFLGNLAVNPDAKGLPAYVQREFYDYLQCGILAYGFLRLECDNRSLTPVYP